MGAVCVKTKKKVPQIPEHQVLYAKEGIHGMTEILKTEMNASSHFKKDQESEQFQQHDLHPDQFQSYRKEVSNQEVFITINDKSEKSLLNWVDPKHSLDTAKADENGSHNKREKTLEEPLATSLLKEEGKSMPNTSSEVPQLKTDTDFSSLISPGKLEGTCCSSRTMGVSLDELLRLNRKTRILVG